MDVATKREEQQARYESIAQARSDGPDPGTTRLEAMKLINSRILDYKHEHPANLRKIIELLLKLCQNICDNPDEPKFRKPDDVQIRARNAAFASCIAPNIGAIKLLSLSGWHAVTDNLEKTWIFDHAADSPQMRVLPDIVTELKKALDEVNRKDKGSDTSDKKRAEQARHETALSQIDEDRRNRLEKQARMREAELANSMAAEAATQEAGGPSEAPEPNCIAEEHLLGDGAFTEQEGPLRRRRAMSSDQGVD